MAENVATKALRGLSNALELEGERSAPPGIELRIPSQPVDDLTQYIRYGSAHVFGKFSDGWVTLALRDVVVGASFATTVEADWSAIISGDFGVNLGRLGRMGLWIYGVSLEAASNVSLDDIGACSLDIPVAIGMRANSGTSPLHTLFASDGKAANRVETGALSVRLINQMRPYFPFQWAAGQAGTFRNQGVNAINVVTFEWTLLCRMLPMGQAPLP